MHRCLKRLGVNRLPPAEGPSRVGWFEEAPCGYIHMDLKVLSPLHRRASYVFVAIDRATRYVFVRLIPRRDAQTVAQCLAAFLNAFPYPIHTILTDNDGAFTDRFAVCKRNKVDGQPTGTHPFDQLCQAHHITHRLIRPFRPQTNGMVERFNRRISEALRNRQPISANQGKNKFPSHEERNRFIQEFVENYNRTRLRCLGYKAPLEVLMNHAKPYTDVGGEGGTLEQL